MQTHSSKLNESRRHFVKNSTIILAVSFGYFSLKGCSEITKSTFKEEIEMSNDLNDRYFRGLEKLKEIDGDAGERVINSLQKIAPDLGRYTIEFPFGDIYSREGLDLKSREIATVAALSAMGNAAPQLKVHINAALNVGCTPGEIVEVIIQMSVYAGFPAALNAAFIAESVFSEHGII